MTKPKERIEYFSQHHKSAIVPFENWFGEANEAYNDFMVSLVQKKSYIKILPLICKENNNILNRNEDLAGRFLYSYLVIKRGLDLGLYKSDSNHFISDIVTQIITPELLDEVTAYVEEKYTMNADKRIDLNDQKFDPGTTFKDRHFKMLYTISALSRLIAPICTHFVFVSAKMNAKKFFYEAFMNVFRLVQTKEGHDIYSKLHTIIYRAISKTRKVDDRMWEQMKILATTPESSVEEAMSKMITDVIPKFVFDKDVMNLMTVVMRFFVKWSFRKKHPFVLHTLSDVEGQGGDDDSAASEADIFDSYNVRRDEGILVFRKFYADDTINKIMMRNGITISKEELDFYMNTPRKFHDIQKFCITAAFSKPFGGPSNIHGLNRRQYMKLIIILSKMMRKLEIVYLPEYLLSERVSFAIRRVTKSFEQTLANDPVYQSLVTEKYEAIQNVFAKKDFIKAQMVMLMNNDYKYLSYGNPLFGAMIEKNEMTIMRDVLDFFNLLVV